MPLQNISQPYIRRDLIVVERVFVPPAAGRVFDETHEYGIADEFIPPAPPRSFEEELRLGLQRYAPTPTSSGISSSFYVCDSRGIKVAVFKPMDGETGGRTNHRVRPSQNVQFRETIAPGQGAGNEVLAYELDQKAFGGRYGIPKTELVRLNHASFEGEELGSVQRFIANARPYRVLSAAERAAIPAVEWEKLNFELITGATDAHDENVLVADGKLYLIDSGDNFVGAAGQFQYLNPWTIETRAHQLMSASEYQRLASINIDQVMDVFWKTAWANEEKSSVLHVSRDKYMTQYLRLCLAKIAGQQQLTQAEWFAIMSPKVGADGRKYPSDIEQIYSEYIAPHTAKSGDWHEIVKMVSWPRVNGALVYAAQQQIAQRQQLVNVRWR